MSYQIVEPKEDHISEIEAWLDAEEAFFEEALERWEQNGYLGDRPVRGFRCNWGSAKRWQEEGHTPMVVLVVDGQAVGFLAGTDILEIKPGMRGRGYGRILAEYMVERARSEGRSVVKITVAPSSAEPFWLRMGFTLVEEHNTHGNGTFAYKTLPKKFELGDGPRVPYAISFYTQKQRYSDIPIPFSRFVGKGEQFFDGRIQLPERAFCFNPVDDQHVDYFVKIEVEGRVIHFDKAKYDSSKAFGARRDLGYDYFFDGINPYNPVISE
jgi:GNAT superfamily N-acetyltransferase